MPTYLRKPVSRTRDLQLPAGKHAVDSTTLTVENRSPARWIPRKHSMVDRNNSAHAATFSPMQFPLVLPLKYRTIFPKVIAISGRGSTVLLSSTDIVFNADQPLVSGARYEISIDWPVLLEGRIGLQLVLHSVINRSEGQFVMGRFSQYEFRTRGPRSNIFE